MAAAAAVFNPFREVGDVVHFGAKLLLVYKVVTSKDCRGLSLRTQLLYLCVFLTRYTDLLTTFVSWYNSLMKAAYIALTLVACGALQIKQRNLQEPSLDTFPLWAAVGPSLLLSAIPVRLYFEVITVPGIAEYLWYFSVTLEALAMIPQYQLLLALGDVDRVTLSYIICQGPYLWLCGTVQTLLFGGYVAYWASSRKHAKSELAKQQQPV